jgi:hypothetical protein
MRPLSLPCVTRSALTLLALSLLAPGAIAQAAPPSAAYDSLRSVAEPFVRITDTGREGYARSAYDRDHYEAFRAVHEEGRLARLEDLPLPGELRVQLVLRPIEVWEEGGTAIVHEEDGSVRRLASTVRMFSVFVPGRPSRGFLGVTSASMQGYLMIDGVNYFVSTGRDERGLLMVTHENHFDFISSHGNHHSHGNHNHHEHLNSTCEEEESPGWCHTEEEAILAANPPQVASVAPLQPQGQQRATLLLRDIKVFIEADKRVRNRFATAQDVVDYCTLLVGASSEIYRRDLGIRLILPSGYVRVSNGVTELWEGHPGGYENWFNSPSNPLFGIQRGYVNKLTGFGRGSSARGLLCLNNEAFAYSEVKGTFPYPLEHTSSNNWDLYAFGQESGHIFSGLHTQNMKPPIPCDDGSGPDEGTLMSYCAFPSGSGLWEPLQSQPEKIGMRFHERVQQRLRNFIKSTNCPDLTQFERGDYDANGVIDIADLAEFDAYLAQGFSSIGARLAFDFNGNGTVGGGDRLQLLAKMIAPASSTVFNGSGANCSCLTPVTQPVLGSTWETRVGDYVGAPIVTVVVGSLTQLAPPTNSRYGELLVGINGFGGQTLFQSVRLTNGIFAAHKSALPYDTSFAGTTVHTQAALCKPTGAVLSNGMTLQVSTY